jgi:AraC-like DNA-binding protein
MILKDFAPHPALSEFVKCYRIVHFNLGNTTNPVLKAYAPRPETCLHFFLRERELVQLNKDPIKDYKYPIVLAGQQTSVINRYLLGGQFITFNIIFQPNALFRLVGIPSFELTDKYLDAEHIFSKTIRLVLEQLQGAIDYSQMIIIANQFINTLVLKVKKEAHRIDYVTRIMLTSTYKISLDWLGKESCLSTKQFTRKFYERTGVNPKTYMRIIRFNKAINLKNAYPNNDWLQIALECGYFDYQHLVKDYKEFTNYKPNEFYLIESNSPERKFGIASEIYRSRVDKSALQLDNVSFLPPAIKH